MAGAGAGAGSILPGGGGLGFGDLNRLGGLFGLGRTGLLDAIYKPNVPRLPRRAPPPPPPVFRVQDVVKVSDNAEADARRKKGAELGLGAFLVPTLGNPGGGGNTLG